MQLPNVAGVIDSLKQFPVLLGPLYRISVPMPGTSCGVYSETEWNISTPRYIKDEKVLVSE